MTYTDQPDSSDAPVEGTLKEVPDDNLINAQPNPEMKWVFKGPSVSSSIYYGRKK